MGTEVFQAKIIGYGALEEWYRRHPRMVQYAASDMLNQLAFMTKRETFDVISEEMIIRKSRFVSSSVRVTKSKGYHDINRQKSIAGSVFRSDFSGWLEQETGEESEKTRSIFKAARRGNIHKVVSPGFRMKPSSNFLSPDSPDFANIHESDNRKSIIMINMLARKGYSRPFIIKGHDKFSPGLYKFKGRAKTVKGTTVKNGRKKHWKFKRRQLLKLQSFKTHPKPKRIQWMKMSKDRVMASVNLNDMWSKALMRQIRFRSKIRFR